MGILYKHYFGRLRLWRYSEIEQNPGPRASRRLWYVVYANIRRLHKSLSNLFLAASGDVVFCSETIFSSRCHIADLIVPRFGRPMQLLKGEVDRFGGLALYVHKGFSANRQRSYGRKCREVIVVWICINNHNFYVLGVHRIPDLSDKIFTLC